MIEKAQNVGEEEKTAELGTCWADLKAAMEVRREKIDAAVAELSFQSTVNEEIAWATEKIRLLDVTASDMNLDAVRDQMKKLDALQIDIGTHKSRVTKLEENNAQDQSVLLLKDRLEELDNKYDEVWGRFEEKQSFLLFKRRCQNGSDWINDRLHRIENENLSINDLSMILARVSAKSIHRN